MTAAKPNMLLEENDCSHSGLLHVIKMNVSHLPGYASEYSVPPGRRVCLDSWISHYRKGMRHGEGGGVFATVSSWMLDLLNQAEGGRERPDHCAVRWKRFKTPDNLKQLLHVFNNM